MTKWALVTGGSQRIGASINKHLAKAGMNIILHYHQSLSAAQRLKEALNSEGVKVILWQADFSEPSSLEKSIDLLYKKVPYINLLINNASIFEDANIQTASLKQIKNNLDIHVTSPWLLMKFFYKFQAKHNISAQIINILDANSNHLYTNKAPYIIAKRSLETLTELAAIEFSPEVRVNAIAPGFLLQAVNSNVILDAKKANLLERQIPIADLLSTLDFLLYNESLTGQIIYLAGGSHLSCPPYMSRN